MDTVLKSIGLSSKERSLYQLLLERTAMPASEISKKIRESRTNTYQLLERLEQQGLIEEDNNQPVKRFTAKDPKVLDELLADRQREILQQRTSLKVELDDLRSRYRLARHKPGVISGEGLENFDSTLKAMDQATTPILIFGSADTPDNPEAYELLKKRIYRRKRKGIPAKILFHKDQAQDMLREEFKNRGFETKFIGDTPFAGEVVVYDDTVVFTTYVPALITTTITGERLAVTMRTIFDLLWCSADN